jgi:hypothetical protein
MRETRWIERYGKQRGSDMQTQQGHLWDEIPDFDGKTYERDEDHGRLARQLNMVRAIMRDGKWHTLGEISERVGSPEASISARLRDLRKPKFGGLTVDRQRRAKGLFEYRVEY